jgi:hypothetical protein
LRAEFDLRRGFKILAGESGWSATDDGALRGLRDRCRGEGRSRGGKRQGMRGVHETDAAIGDGEEEMRFVGVFDFGRDALDGSVRDLAEGLQRVAVEDGN